MAPAMPSMQWSRKCVSVVNPTNSTFRISEFESQSLAAYESAANTKKE
jgi:hypothetical protein